MVPVKYLSSLIMISHLELLNFNWMTYGQLYIDLIPSHYSTFFQMHSKYTTVVYTLFCCISNFSVHRNQNKLTMSVDVCSTLLQFLKILILIQM